jgi:outer membrane protein OmpA-like peptidoglycan-associated protein
VALSIENLASEVSASERFLLRRTIGRLQGSVTQFESTVGSLRSTVAALEERLRGISAGYAPTVRERLDFFARSHAIFFSDDTTFADEAAAAAVLDQVAELIKATGTLVRIVGFTDETGQPQRNQVLATERASRVRAALVQRGVPAELLAVIGRADGVRISTQRGGSGSPNRRVEFEPAFVNEPRGG